MAVQVLLGQAWGVGVCRLVVADVAVEQPRAVDLHLLVSCRVDPRRPSICQSSAHVWRTVHQTSLKYLLNDNIDERSPLGICFTTGTTGRPKGVTYTHRSTVSHALTIATGAGMSLGPADCTCAMVP